MHTSEGGAYGGGMAMVKVRSEQRSTTAALGVVERADLS